VAKIVPNVHRIHTTYKGRNLYQHIIERNGRMLLVDTGAPDTPESLLFPYMEEHGLHPSAIGAIIVTHADYDHRGGTIAIKRRAPEALLIAQKQELEPLRAIEGMPAIDVTFDGELRFGFPSGMRNDNIPVHLYHAPGHSAGHLIVHLPLQRTAIITDAALGEWIPDVGGEPSLPPIYFDAEAYLRTIEKIRGLDAEVLMASHFPLIAGKEQVAGFLDGSRDFVYRVESYLLEKLERADGFLDIPALILQSRGRLGRWKEEADQALQACFHAGLHRLKERGAVAQAPGGKGWSLRRTDLNALR